MTYPQVTVRGENLPEPFEGWDDREYSDETEAMYCPSRFSIKGELGMLYLEWESDSYKEQRWIDLDNIDSIDSSYKEETDN